MTRTDPAASRKADDGDLPVVALTSSQASAEQVAQLIEIEAAAAERMTFFSDAVVAIAITLLALELPLPGETALDGMSNGALLDFFAMHGSAYLAFVISFFVIGGHWTVHHALFRYLTRLGGPLLRLNLLWLLFIVITPVATKLLNEGGHPDFLVTFTAYAGVQAVQPLVMLAMIGQMRRRGLLRPDTPLDVIAAARGRSLATFVAFAASIPAGFLLGGEHGYPYIFWFAVPVVWILVVRIRQRRAGRPRGERAVADGTASR